MNPNTGQDQTPLTDNNNKTTNNLAPSVPSTNNGLEDIFSKEELLQAQDQKVLTNTQNIVQPVTQSTPIISPSTESPIQHTTTQGSVPVVSQPIPIPEHPIQGSEQAAPLSHPVPFSQGVQPTSPIQQNTFPQSQSPAPIQSTPLETKENNTTNNQPTTSVQQTPIVQTIPTITTQESIIPDPSQPTNANATTPVVVPVAPQISPVPVAAPENIPQTNQAAPLSQPVTNQAGSVAPQQVQQTAGATTPSPQVVPPKIITKK